MESCRRYRVICISRKTEILHNWSNLIAPAALDVSKICRDKNRDKNRDTSMKLYLKKNGQVFGLVIRRAEK